MKLEIERKFLLKSLPKIPEKDIFKIDQYYYKNKSGVWERARKYQSDISGETHIHTIKRNISRAVNVEKEKTLTKKQYQKFKNLCLSGEFESRFISKERFIYDHLSDNLIWEVDKFGDGYHLIVAEIEVPQKSYVLEIPDFIEEVMLMEVTGMKQFNNKNLSIKIL